MSYNKEQMTETQMESPDNTLMPREPGLTAANFRRVSRNGFGDPYNSYAHSMIWFQDHLYVGTTRAPLAYRGRQRAEDQPDWIGRIWPVRIPVGIWDIDLRAEIWRYHPPSDTWRKMFTSPLVEGVDGDQVPLSVAFRSMVRFQGSSDSGPAIYAPTMATYQTSAVMLRSVDGVRFEIVTHEGMGFPDPYKPRGVRAIAAFRDRLFSSPAVAKKGQRKSYNFPESMVILTTTDPTQGQWQLACEPHFGDPNNLSVFQMAEFKGCLYVGTMNVNQGFQIWKTDAEGVPPFKWKKVIEKGAYRGKLNQGAISMQTFGNHLYVGTGIQEGGYDRYNSVGPGAAEIIRINPDDTWDLVVGEPRHTPQGLKMPLSGLDSGFGKPFAGYLWSMCVHEKWLYAGTFDWLMAVRYGKMERWPEHVRRMLSPKNLELLISRFGGFDLWRTPDGHSWMPVTQTGFGNYFNVGARTMTSTPYGLFVGTANSFAPDVAVDRIAGWNYEENSRGGLEVWLGSRPESPTRPEEGGGRPFICPAKYPRDTNETAEDIRARTISELYGGRQFRHVGFWRADTRDLPTACEQLMEEILAFIPRREGTIVDLGCGRGSTTRCLLKYYAPDAITGITFSRKDLGYCRKTTPQVKFLLRKPPKLKLPPKSADAIIFVKTLDPWPVSAGLFQEIYRTLAPGGQLVCFDIVPSDHPQKGNFIRSRNRPIRSIPEYQDLLRDTGLSQVQCTDVTRECLNGFAKFAATYLEMKKISGQIDNTLLEEIKTDLMLDVHGHCNSILLAAEKGKEGTRNSTEAESPLPSRGSNL